LWVAKVQAFIHHGRTYTRGVPSCLIHTRVTIRQQDYNQDGVITRKEFHDVMEREALATKLSLTEGTLEEQLLEIQQAVDRTVFSLCQQLEGLWGGSID
jgi:cobyric acid synthase